MIGGLVDRHTIIRKRAALVDDGRGNMTQDWDNPVETPLPGWAIDASGSSEDLVNREGSASTYTLRGPFAADVKGTDRIVLFGDEFTISGGVQRQPGVTDLTSHTLIVLTAWEG